MDAGLDFEPYYFLEAGFTVWTYVVAGLLFTFASETKRPSLALLLTVEGADLLLSGMFHLLFVRPKHSIRTCFLRR